MRTVMVSRAAAARVLDQLVAERNDEDGKGGIEALARECHGAMPSVKLETFARAIYRIRTGKAKRRDGTAYVQRQVTFETVDLILTAVDRPDLWHSDELRRWGAFRPGGSTQPRRYRGRQPAAKMTDQQVRDAHTAYMDGKSLRALARDLWETYGYASPGSCVNALSAFFIRDGLPTRDRIEATIAASTVHGLAGRDARARTDLRFRMHRKRLRRERGEARGVRCSATTQHGECLPRPCRAWALAGKTVCWAHDPDRAEQRVAIVANMRAHLQAAA